MVILLLIAPVLLYRLCRRFTDPTNAFVRASVAWGILVLLVVEVLSMGRMVSAAGFVSCWAAITAAVGGLLWYSRHKPPVPTTRAPLPTWAVALVIVTLCVTLVIALVAPPNSTDALTYHLARVAQWRQQGSVAPYATSVTRQIYMAPWPAYVTLHLQVLAGGADRFAALLQWSSFLGCIGLGYSLARRLGADLQGATLAGVLVVTLPTAIIEASSTQTSLVVAFWCAVFAWITLGPMGLLGSAALGGAALGLAVASKGTAYVICAPLAAWWVLRCLRSAGVRKAVVHATVLTAVALSVNLPSYVRNVRVFGDPSAPASARAALGNGSHGFGTLVSNVLRNATVHLRTPSVGLNSRLARGVKRLHEWAGLDVQDPRTTYPGTRFSVTAMSTYEGRTGNLLHLLLIGIAGVLLVARPNTHLTLHYGLAILAGALLFCWVFRWQHWHGRLHTPLFVLAAPFTAIGIQPLLRAWHRATVTLAIALWVAALPWLVANNMRPLVNIPETRLSFAASSIFSVPREQQFFDQQSTVVYRRVVDHLERRRCGDIGIVGGEQSRIYPLVAFGRTRGLDVRTHYVFVTNATRRFAGASRVCALFVVEPQPVGWQPGAPYDSFGLAWRDHTYELWQEVDREFRTQRDESAATVPGAPSLSDGS